MLWPGFEQIKGYEGIMVHINMLPWREQARKIKKKNFFISLMVAMGVTFFIIFLFHMYYDALIAYQDRRNAFLQEQISKKQLEIDVLREDKKQQDNIQAKLQFLFALREQSYHAVRLLSELLKIVPDTITLSKLQREGRAIVIEGKAQSELSITAFLKSISQDPVFNQPALTAINTGPVTEGASERYFQVKVEQKE